MQVLSSSDINEVTGGIDAKDAIVGAGLSRAASGAGAALGEGIALGFGGGAWLGPAGAVVGAMIGAGIAYWAFS